MIRALRPDDGPQWRALRLEALRTCPIAFADSFEEASRNDLAAFVARMPSAESPDAIFGAFQGETLVGSAGFRAYPTMKLRHKGVLWGMYVGAPQRGNGVGAALVRAVIERARSHVAVLQLSVAVDNPKARALYHRAGFVPYGLERQGLRIDGKDHDEELLAMYFDAQ